MRNVHPQVTGPWYLMPCAKQLPLQRLCMKESPGLLHHGHHCSLETLASAHRVVYSVCFETLH